MSAATTPNTRTRSTGDVPASTSPGRIVRTRNPRGVGIDGSGCGSPPAKWSASEPLSDVRLTPAAAEPEKAKATRPKPPKQTAPAPVIASTDAKGESRVVRQGIYITADEFTDAKSAYLADWQAGG